MGENETKWSGNKWPGEGGRGGFDVGVCGCSIFLVSFFVLFLVSVGCVVVSVVP